MLRHTPRPRLSWTPVRIVALLVILSSGAVSIGIAAEKEEQKQKPAAGAAESKRDKQKDKAGDLQGDKIPTSKGDLVVHPIHHASLVLGWNKLAIYVDPVGEAKLYEGLPPPDLILITHDHGDHLDGKLVHSLVHARSTIVAPESCLKSLRESPDVSKHYLSQIKTLSNAKSLKVEGIQVEAVPMYNTSPDRQKFHPKGKGNGYVLDLAGTKVYISGDTEETEEMRQLKGIHVAFIAMNLPYTMTAEQLAKAIAAFKPKVVYPYHYRSAGREAAQDPAALKKLVEAKDKGIEIRVRDWYADDKSTGKGEGKPKERPKGKAGSRG